MWQNRLSWENRAERCPKDTETWSRALRSATLTPSDSLLQSPADTWHPPQHSRGMQSTKNSEVTQTAPRSACGFGAGVPQTVFCTPCPVNLTLFLVAAATAMGLAGFWSFSSYFLLFRQTHGQWEVQRCLSLKACQWIIWCWEKVVLGGVGAFYAAGCWEKWVNTVPSFPRVS